MNEGGAPDARRSESGLLEQDLARELERGRVVVVVGAGVAVAATRGEPVASWVGLLEDGISRCEQVFLSLPADWGERLRGRLRSGRAEDLLAVADEVTSALGGRKSGEYRRWLRETVGQLEPRDPEVIEALHDLGVPIVTTNYDSLIEQVTGLEPVTWRGGPRIERLLRGDEPGVLHLHGHWEDPESVVLGVHSYDEVLGDAYAQFVPRALTAFNSLLFVGCGEGLDDPNFGALRRWLRDVFGGSEYRHFRLALDGEARAVAATHGPASGSSSSATAIATRTSCRSPASPTKDRPPARDEAGPARAGGAPRCRRGRGCLGAGTAAATAARTCFDVTYCSSSQHQCRDRAHQRQRSHGRGDSEGAPPGACRPGLTSRGRAVRRRDAGETGRGLRVDRRSRPRRSAGPGWRSRDCTRLAVEGEPEVPVLGAGEHVPEPAAKRAEVRILETLAATHEEQRVEGGERAGTNCAYSSPRSLVDWWTPRTTRLRSSQWPCRWSTPGSSPRSSRSVRCPSRHVAGSSPVTCSMSKS